MTAENHETHLGRGWAVVPLDPERKTPIHAGWPARAAARDFTAGDFEGRNVGVVLGSVSGDLADVDLDSAAAVELAPYFLPETLTFGRASKPASHWLYTSPGLTSERLQFEAGDGRELVEIRANNVDGKGCGHQTMFPGSVHPSGETVAFDNDQAPTEIDANDLRWAVARLAVASTILNGWGPDTSRHEKSLGLAGGLLKAGWTPDEVRHCLAAVRACAGDTPEEEKDFSHDVETSIKKIAAGKDVQGFGTLLDAGLITDACAKDLERHAMTPERRKIAADAIRSGRPSALLKAGWDAKILRDTAGMAAALYLDAGHASPPPTAEPGATDPHPLLGRRINLAEEPAELAYLFKGLPFAPGGKVNAIAGRPNASKSPFAELLLFAHVTGTAVCGLIPLRKGWGLYQDAETGLIAHRRWRRICRAYNVEPASIEVDFRDVDVMFSEQYCAQLEDYCAARGENGMVVIDTYGAMLEAKIDNNSPEFAHWLKQLGRLSRRLAVVIVVLIHNNKSSRDGELEGIGGNIQGAGAMQGVVTLERTGKGNDAPIQVWCTRAPEEDFTPFQIRWEDTKPHSETGKSGLKAERVEVAQVTSPDALTEKQRVKTARSIIDCITRTPHQNKSHILKGSRGARETEKSRIFDDLVEAGILIEIKTAERVNGRGEVEPILVYEAAALSPAVIEKKLKAGIVE